MLLFLCSIMKTIVRHIVSVGRIIEEADDAFVFLCFIFLTYGILRGLFHKLEERTILFIFLYRNKLVTVQYVNVIFTFWKFLF